MSNNKYKILVIEDESNIRSFMVTILNANGYQALTAKTCNEGILMHASYSPDLVILDLGLPDRDGLEFLKHIRKSYNTPVIVLSARSDEKDKVMALDLGANDYITKPFGTAELFARMRAALRNKMLSSDVAVYEGKYRLNDMLIDYDKRRVFIGENEIKLTQTEFNIISLLSRHDGKVLTYAAIIKEIWGVSDDGSIKKLQVNMANIRKKMGAKPGENKYIVNELGVGYRMSDEML